MIENEKSCTELVEESIKFEKIRLQRMFLTLKEKFPKYQFDINKAYLDQLNVNLNLIYQDNNQFGFKVYFNEFGFTQAEKVNTNYLDYLEYISGRNYQIFNDGYRIYIMERFESCTGDKIRIHNFYNDSGLKCNNTKRYRKIYNDKKGEFIKIRKDKVYLTI